MARLWLHDYDVGALEPSQRYRVPRHVTPADHVHDARRAVGRRNALRPELDRSDHRVLSAILVTTGSLGIAVLANFLVGPWQVVSFAISVIVFVTGLILTWTR